MSTKWVTAADATGREGQSPQWAVGFHGFDGIGRAGGEVAACRRTELSVLLVPIEGRQDDALHDVTPDSARSAGSAGSTSAATT